MEKLLSEMKMENKYNRNISMEHLDIGMENTIIGMKCVTSKYGKKLVVTIDFKSEIVDLFAPKRFDTKAADLEKQFKKLDESMILKVIIKRVTSILISNSLLNIKLLHFIDSRGKLEYN